MSESVLLTLYSVKKCNIDAMQLRGAHACAHGEVRLCVMPRGADREDALLREALSAPVGPPPHTQMLAKLAFARYEHAI